MGKLTVGLALLIAIQLSLSAGNAWHTGFFLTPPAEKIKIQEKSPSKKLKEKTQLLGGLSLS